MVDTFFGSLYSTYKYLGNRGIIDTSNLGTPATEHPRRSGDHGEEGIPKNECETDPDNSSNSKDASSPNALDESSGSPPKRSNSFLRLPFGAARHPLDPHGYRHAKRRLRKAVIEHYRCVELSFLRNFAIAKATVCLRLDCEHDANTQHILVEASRS